MMTIEMETVTPEKAKTWLSRSKNPRKLKPRHVQDFVRHLHNRTFELTHQGLALDDNGYLVDGQHRLHAIIETGQTVDMFVARGVSAKGLIVVDRGQRRDNSTVLRCSAEVARVVSLAARLVAMKTIPMESELLRFKKLLEGDCELLLEACPAHKRRLSTGCNLLGATMNMGQNPDWVCAQWRAFILGDFPKQSRSVQWLYRRLVGERNVNYSQALVYPFKAFNKENSDGSSMTIKNPEINLDEMRKVLCQMAGYNPTKNGE